jgi:uncharacterized membrane protein
MSGYPGTYPTEAAGLAAAVGGTPVFTNIVLILATLLTGLAAGVFALYAHTIMPGLKRTDDRTFVGAFQAIDQAIINPWFMATFFGALIAIGVAGFLHFGAARRAALPWLAVAFVLYLATVIITMAINVPLNDAIKAAGDPDQINVATVRAAFHESTWATWNYVRVVASTGAFAILVGVLAAVRRN